MAIISHPLQIKKKYFHGLTSWVITLIILFFANHFCNSPISLYVLRPGFQNAVREKLNQHSIDYREIKPRMPGFCQRHQIGWIDWIKQGSGDTGSELAEGWIFFEIPHNSSSDKTRKVWDCCAGSGGKSIMLFDIHPGIELTVSDIRESVLANLKNRFSGSRYKRIPFFPCWSY